MVFLICLLLGLLLAPDAAHAASPLTEEVQLLQHETLAADGTTVHVADNDDASAEVQELRTGSCPKYWYSFNGVCYRYVATDLSWADAEKNCVSQRANLVSIHNGHEQAFVRDLIRTFDIGQGYTWIGMTDVHSEGWWTWTDGSKVGYTYWYSKMPDGGAMQNCVLTNYTAEKLQWNDYPCSSRHPSVCKSRPVCP